MRGRDSFVEISIRGWEIRPATLTNDISALSKNEAPIFFSASSSPFFTVVWKNDPSREYAICITINVDHHRRTDDLESKFASGN